LTASGSEVKYVQPSSERGIYRFLNWGFSKLHYHTQLVGN